MTTTPKRMKKLITAPDDVVAEGLAGLAAAHPDLLQVDTANRLHIANRFKFFVQRVLHGKLCETGKT